jgi:branched-chain amino acid transport system permease protein
MMPLFADAALDWPNLVQLAIEGLRFGLLIALIALGYTMVYGIVELINFAHGDLFMLGCCLSLTLVTAVGLEPIGAYGPGIPWKWFGGLALCLVIVPIFCALLNYSVDKVVYKPLRGAPKLAPLVSAIGVSFVFMNVGLFWEGPQDVNFPTLLPEGNVLKSDNLLGASAKIELTWETILVVAVTIPIMLALTYFVKFTSLGKAMRATAQNPTAARLMGINTDRVISVTFLIGGTLGGFASVVYGLTVNTVSYQMGFQNGLYAFTAAVLGGIGNIPGAVLGGLLIGMVRTFGSEFVGETWAPALVFVVLIVVLVFRPNGLLGARVREKV